MRLRANLKLGHKAAILVIVPVVFELMFIMILIPLLERMENLMRRQDGIKTVLAKSHEMTGDFFHAGHAVVGWRAAMTEKDKNGWDEEYADKLKNRWDEEYAERVSRIPVLLKEVKNTLQDLPSDQETLQQFFGVETAARSGLDALREAKVRAALGASFNLIMNVDYELKLTKYFRLTDEFVADVIDKKLSETVKSLAQSQTQIISWIYIGVVLNVAIAVALALFFNLSATRRLRTLMNNTVKLAKHQKLDPPVAGTDEIAHLDRVFHKMADDLEEAAQRKKEMVSMVSHDLRTPLMSMQTSLELLSAGVMGELPGKAHEELVVASYSTTSLIHLINDLLDIDKLESGRFELHPRYSDIGWIFERCIASVKALADRNRLTITVPEDDDDVKVYGDPDRLAQVITNLLANAIKFSTPGGTIELAYEDQPNATIVEVIDHGRGIPLPFQSKVFDRFQQVDAADATEKKGTGLGLAICKALVEAHSGAIGLRSEEGKGTTFWFRIPKQRVASAATKS